jgi:hypothetical protein
MKVRTKVVGARFYPEELELIRELAESRGLTLSEQLREAAISYVLRLGKPIAPREKLSPKKAQ